MEYYSAIKRNEVLIPATVWKSPEKIMLSKRSQPCETTYCMIALIEMYRLGKSIETESRYLIA